VKQPNRAKQAMRDGRVAYGYNLVFPSPWVVEILGMLDFDFVWLDGEHGPFSLEAIEDLCRTADSFGITTLARVPDVNPSTILRYLDRGVQGIMGPHISTREDAEGLVNACLFGPQGQRSFGANRGTDYWHEIPDLAAYYQECNENMLVGALLEDRASLDNLDEILSVAGIDYFGIGPNDFAQGMGYPGQPDHPEVVKAMQQMTDRIRSAGGRMGGDFMVSEWITNMLLDSGRRLLGRRKGDAR
jgi:2-keto-3-deoxy-L-rhamnonate aldolase RhmA